MKRPLRDRSLSLTLAALFLTFLAAQSAAGWRVYNAEQRAHGETEVGYGAYLGTGHFFEATFENWESEFLQMAVYVVLSIWLRQQGSPGSKPVYAPHDQTNA